MTPQLSQDDAGVVAPRTHKITLIPGDGIGPEVASATVSILETACTPLGCTFDWHSFEAGADAFAKTGELIWENRIGPLSPHLYGGNRAIALYKDKVFTNTTDAHLVALNAVTGKMKPDEAVAWGAKTIGVGA